MHATTMFFPGARVAALAASVGAPRAFFRTVLDRGGKPVPAGGAPTSPARRSFGRAVTVQRATKFRV